MLSKKEIRESSQKKRSVLSIQESVDKSAKLCEQFFKSIDLSGVNVFHVFLPIVSKNEPNTWMIIEKLIKDFPKMKISIPRMEGSHLANFYFENREQLKKNRWEILEPVSGEPTPTEKIDLVAVPLLAFDHAGHRVGYGKGFYDKFLTECRVDCKKVGLSFFEPVETIETEIHDVKLTHCVTPTKTYIF